jgi:ribosomal protein S18 acetylase RimI-like enzyme
MPYTIRPATAADEPFLWEMLYHAAHMAEDGATSARAARADPFLAQYVQGWGRGGDLGVIALDPSGQPIGAAWARRLPGASQGDSAPHGHSAELAIAVLPAYASQGIGTRLLMALLEAARGVYPAIVLSVRADNPARRLYERMGFVVVDEIVNRVGGRSLVMRIDLDRYPSP